MKRRMKILCMLLAVSCTVSACSKSEKKEEIVLMNSLDVAYSSNGYYYCDFNQILFYDFALDAVVPLCSKAECDHTDKSTCNSYVTRIVSGIQYQNRKLYFLVKDGSGGLVLQQEDMDGTNRKDVCVLAQSYIASDSTVEFMLDGEYIFVKLFTPSGDEGIQSIYYKNIQDSQDMELIYEGENPGESIQLPQCYNGKAYFTTDYYMKNEKQEIVQYGDLYSYDLMGKEIKSLCSDDIWGYVLLENELYYNNYQGEVKKINLDTMESDLLTTVDEDNKYFYLSADSNYLYVDNGPAAMVLNPKGLDARAIFVYDHSGKIVTTLKIPGEEDYSINLSGDDKYLALEGGGRLLLYDKSQIGTQNSEWKTVNFTNQE